jgi:D-alanyl-D-alanine carboxypeptidase
MVASAAPEPAAVTRAAATSRQVVVAEGDGSLAAVAPVAVVRPMPRSLDAEAISRNSASIAAAIAEVNAELTAGAAAGAAARNAPVPREGRPMPRPTSADQAAVARPRAGSASTFAVAEPAAVEVANAGTTGGHDWGVQLGAYRAKGDAERQLLTTALKDVPELAGGLRRVEAAKVQGVTVYRAQFVGLSQADALAACASLARMQAACLPLAPGI